MDAIVQSLYTKDALALLLNKAKPCQTNYLHSNPNNFRSFNSEIGFLIGTIEHGELLLESTFSDKENFHNKEQYTQDMLKSEFARVPHNHNYYEMTIVVQGTITVQIENVARTYTAGDAYLLNRSTFHLESFSEPVCLIYLLFSHEFLSDFSNHIFLDPSAKRKKKFANLHEDLQNITSNKKAFAEFLCHRTDNTTALLECFSNFKMELMHQAPGYRLILFGLLDRCFYLLCDEKNYTAKSTQIQLDAQSSLAQTIIEYLNTKPDKVILKELEKDLHYSADHLNRVFHARYGMTIREYQRQSNMREAASILLRSNETVTSIAQRLGYASYTQFYHTFRNFYGMTPQKYRTLYRETQLNFE